MSIFDDMADTWDDKPDRVERTRTVAQRLRAALDFTDIESALEYGCGTGQLSFALADVLPHCLLMDSSVEMLKVAERGIAERALPWDTERRSFAAHSPDHPVAITDLIFSLQVLHHVDDLDTAFTNMATALRAKGQLAIIDLPVGSAGFHRGSKHNHADNPHLDGLDPHDLEQRLAAAGFRDITWHDDIALVRDGDDGPVPYTLFLVTARV
ncbi:class I SAM-dependent methyltransferase [Tessaracoccus antarcticus]|nr:class I SAM-dependent methyltransferase [Tessaracoccus antarcticus]